MSFRVVSADTDMFARLQPGALLNLLIESAIQSAVSLGFCYEGLKAQAVLGVEQNQP